jgi:chromosome segregation ATPase
MTGDELERAIDFILKSQARAEARIERNEEQLARNEEQLSLLAEQVAQLTRQGADFQKRHDVMEDAHTNFVRVMTQYLETQDQINKSLRETDVRQARFSASLGESLRTSDESLRAAMTELATGQGRTEATVDRLSQKVEALVTLVEEHNRGQ